MNNADMNIAINKIIEQSRLNSTLVVLRGVSGSGKDFFAAKASVAFRDRMFQEYGMNKFETTTISADQFFYVQTEPDRFEYRFDVAKLGEAHADCFKRADLATRENERGYPKNRLVFVNNTNSHCTEIAPYLLLAQSRGLSTMIVHIHAPLSVAAERNVHGTPMKAIEFQYKNLGEPLPAWWSMPYLHVAE